MHTAYSLDAYIGGARITPDEAYLVFQSVLHVKGFTTVPSGAFTKIVPVRDARETTVPTAADCVSSSGTTPSTFTTLAGGTSVSSDITVTRNNFAVIRKLKDIALHLKNSYKTIVLVSPVLEIPTELEKLFLVIEHQLPDRRSPRRWRDRREGISGPRSGRAL